MKRSTESLAQEHGSSLCLTHPSSSSSASVFVADFVSQSETKHSLHFAWRSHRPIGIHAVACVCARDRVTCHTAVRDGILRSSQQHRSSAWSSESWYPTDPPDRERRRPPDVSFPRRPRGHDEAWNFSLSNGLRAGTITVASLDPASVFARLARNTSSAPPPVGPKLGSCFARWSWSLLVVLSPESARDLAPFPSWILV